MKKFYKCVLLALTLLSGIVLFARAEPPKRNKKEKRDDYTLDSLRHERKRMADRKRKIIYNDDGNETYSLLDTVSEQAFLQPRLTGIETSQVSSIYYCTSNPWGLFNHNTHVGTVLTYQDDPLHPTGMFPNNLTAAYISAGLDPLNVVTNFGHTNGKEVFWSMRMNDTHDSELHTYGPVLLSQNVIKSNHPEYLVGTIADSSYVGWTAADYAQQAVRDTTLRFIQDVCQNYDVDGIELDFYRHRVFFKSTLKGLVATSTEVADMTALIRQIRGMTEDEGLARHRPFLISVRVPDSESYCKALGLDITTWLNESLVDILVIGGYNQLTPWKNGITLGHNYNVQVYTSFDDPRNTDAESETLRNTDLCYRGRAMASWSAGTDGIYMFNFFNPTSPLWNQIGDTTTLKNLDKDYFASVLGVGRKEAVNHTPYTTIPTLNPSAPITIAAFSNKSTSFDCGDNPTNISAAELRLRFSGTVTPANIQVALNNIVLPAAQINEHWLSIDINPTLLVKDSNNVKVTSLKSSSMSWTDLQVITQTKASIGTGLASGDIAFTGYKTSAADTISFIVLKTGGLQSGTVIGLTDNGRTTTSSWRNSEGVLTWKATSAIAAGQQVRVWRTGSDNGTVTATGTYDLAGSGDQVIAFQGGVWPDPTRILAGVHFFRATGTTDANWDIVNGSAASVYPSRLLPGHGVWVRDVSATTIAGFGIYDGSYSSSMDTLRSMINNNSHWIYYTGSNPPFNLPPVIAPPGARAAQLEYFTVQPQGATSKVSWTISSEKDNSEFIIERAGIDKNFSALSSIKGLGVQQNSNAYAYTDTHPLPGINYYRLIQKSVGGVVDELGIKSIDFKSTPDFNFIVFPNPTTDRINVKLENYTGNEIHATLRNFRGKIIIEEKLNTATVKDYYTIPFKSKLPGGQYILTLQGVNLSKSMQVLVL